MLEIYSRVRETQVQDANTSIVFEVLLSSFHISVFTLHLHLVDGRVRKETISCLLLQEHYPIVGALS